MKARLLLAGIVALVPFFASADWRMIVKLKPGADLASAQDAAASMGGSVVDHTPNAPFVLLSLPSDPLTYAIAQYEIAAGIVDVLWTGDDTVLWSAESISRGGSLSVISRGGSLSVIGDEDDLVDENQGFLSQVDWSENLANSDGRTVRVAILDGGLSRLQTGLWSQVDASFDVFGGISDDIPMGRDSNEDGVVDGGTGHGTMVAGLIHTIAPKVRFVVAKVADSDGRASAWGIVKGLAFAVAQGAEVANVSLGSEDMVPAFSSAADWARAQGLVVVSAIGNSNEPYALYPSGDSLSLCVAGLNADDTKASFSNYDPKADACAPAVGLVSHWWHGGYARWSGTSFAAPFVTAALADCLRRTTPKTASQMIGALAASGRTVDGINLPYAGKIGKVVDIAVLDAKLRGTP